MEQQILQFLQHSPGSLYSIKEVSKRVDRDRYREDANWARPYLRALLEKGLIAQDVSGCYYLPRG
jgi:DNA-binding IclR family transcriptional regulator